MHERSERAVPVMMHLGSARGVAIERLWRSRLRGNQAPECGDIRPPDFGHEVAFAGGAYKVDFLQLGERSACVLWLQ